MSRAVFIDIDQITEETLLCMMSMRTPLVNLQKQLIPIAVTELFTGFNPEDWSFVLLD